MGITKIKNKLKSKKGFTLIEMLIVVAIIAILVAIAIPAVNSSLDKARTSTDDANLRAAKTAAISKYISNEETETKTYSYKDDGTLIDGNSASGDGFEYGQSKAHKGDYIVITVNADGSATAKWSKES